MKRKLASERNRNENRMREKREEFSCGRSGNRDIVSWHERRLEIRK